jgi:hypothetical protein
VIAWLNKQVNEKLTLSATEFDKYSGKQGGSQPLSASSSLDHNKVGSRSRALFRRAAPGSRRVNRLAHDRPSMLQSTGGASLGSIQKVIYRPTSTLPNENKTDSAVTASSMSDSSGVLTGRPVAAVQTPAKATDETGKPTRYPLKSISQLAKPSSYF